MPAANVTETTTRDLCERIEPLIERERVLDALDLARAHAPWAEWTEPAALIVASRVVGMAGDNRLGRELTLRAWRKAPTDTRVAYHYALDWLRRHGAYETLRWMDARGLATDTSGPLDKPEASLLALRARLLGQFRDFTAAEALMARAVEALPDDGWLRMEQSDLLRAQDRYDEALAASVEMLQLRPWRRWAVRTHSDLLRLRGRDEEALELLRAATAQTQSGYLAVDLAAALEETGKHEDVLAALALAEARLPLASKADLVWLHARRCDALHRLGRGDEARAAAETAASHGAGYYAKIAARLAEPAAPEEARRVHLPVGFVRQHHMTCAPATVAAVAGFWGRPIDHLKLAADICYDGTPDHAERAWLQERGWLVREFTVDWPTAVALLDRGCPILIVTVGVGSAHMQAVIGYDRRLGTLLVRDPYERTFSEWNAEGMFKEQAAHGPRGAVVLPAEEASRLDGLVLPEAALYDAWFAFRRALFLHRREAAEAALATLAEAGPDHPLTHRARRDLAHYDGHAAQALPSIEALRRLFPEQVNFQVEHIDLLEHLGRDNEARDLLDKLGAGRGTYFTLQRRRAQNRLADARTAPRAGRVLRRILRFNATDPEALRAHANALWGAGDHASALGVYRLAATSGDKAEHHWRAYFTAARWQRREGECLALLRERFARWGDLSDRPARTLAEALEDLDRTEEAMAVLEEARRRRPRDGELALHLASKLSRHNRRAEAAALLESARGDCSPGNWLRHVARQAERDFDHARALELWREVVALAPENIEAQETCARLLRIREGRAAALAWLDAACAAAPHRYALSRMRLEYLRDEPAELALAAADALLAASPADAWALRERAFILRRLGRGATGVEPARAALEIEPRAPSSHCVLSRCLRDAGRLEEARAAAREGIRLDVDASHLFSDLLLASTTLPERREAVLFMETELVRQVSVSGPVLDFVEAARGILDDAELLAAVRRVHAAQPEYWSGGSALAACLADQDALPEALETAEANARRFPLVPRVWRDLADIRRKRGELDAEIAALEQTLALSPGWGDASRRLSFALERKREPALAEQVLRRAVANMPTDAVGFGWLADLLWRDGRAEEALATMEQALRVDPTYEWGWEQMHAWSLGMHRRSRAVALAEELTAARPGEPESWLRLARLRGNDEHAEENLVALARAEALAPLEMETHDLRVQLLVQRQRWAEALRACDPPAYGGRAPHFLRGREAWVHAEAGRTDEAIRRMEAVVAGHPDYVWGWARLTDWLSRADRGAEAEKAAERWAKLTPRSPVPLGRLGDLQLKGRRADAAHATFRRALDLYPDYGYAAHRLLEAHLEARNFAEAEKLTEHIRAHFSRAEHLRARGLLLARKDGALAALPALEELARSPDASFDHLREVFEVALKDGYKRRIGAVLRRLLEAEETHPDLAELWVAAQAKRGRWAAAWAFHRVRPAEIHRRKLTTRHISQMAERRAVTALLWLLVSRRKELRRDPEWWGELGYAWTHLEYFRLAARWMKDWARTDAQPYMLSNLALAHFSLNRPARALPVVRRALELPSDGSYTKLNGWLALEASLAGDDEAARRALATGEAPMDKPYARVLHGLTEALLGFGRLAPDEREVRLVEVMAEVESLRGDYPDLARGIALRIHFVRTKRRLARLGGSWWWMVRTRLPAFSSQSETPGDALPYRFSWWHLFVAYLVLRALSRLAAGP